MKLPAFLQSVQDWMERYEKEAAALTDAFLKMDSKKDLFINLFMVGLLPAIGEEFLFRGVIQKLLRQMTGNAHSAIIITAILFSAIHMQFFGFVPRFLLGAFFGYLLYWSGSIWLPVTAHFVNNGMAVIFSWYQQRNQLPFNPDTVGSEMRDWWIVLLSTVTVVVIAFNLKRKYR